MLSNSRIYIFEIQYKDKEWMTILETNELSGLLANILTGSIPDLQFKNIQFINVYKSGRYNSEIHINKLKYKSRRTLDKNQIKELQSEIRKQLTKIISLKYSQLHLVNDEFSVEPSPGFMTEEMFYV